MLRFAIMVAVGATFLALITTDLASNFLGGANAPPPPAAPVRPKVAQSAAVAAPPAAGERGAEVGADHLAAIGPAAAVAERGRRRRWVVRTRSSIASTRRLAPRLLGEAGRGRRSQPQRGHACHGGSIRYEGAPSAP